MIESDVWKALITILRTNLDEQGLNDVTIHQAFQPIKQGIDSARSIYLHKISSKRIGHQGRSYNYNAGNDNFDVNFDAIKGTCPLYDINVSRGAQNRSVMGASN